MTNTLYFPTHYRQSRSRNDGKPYTTIYFTDIATGQECYTHIYSTCRNKIYWNEIIEKRHRDLVIKFDNIIFKDQKRGLIDADSIPTIYEEFDKGVIQQELRDYLQEQDRRREEKTVQPEGLFGKLFEVRDVNTR